MYPQLPLNRTIVFMNVLDMRWKMLLTMVTWHFVILFYGAPGVLLSTVVHLTFDSFNLLGALSLADLA